MEIEFIETSSLTAKQMMVPAGQAVGKHIHSYDHVSILAKGKVIVHTVTGGIKESELHDGPTCLVIKAGVQHEIIAITDTAWFCIHAKADTTKEGA